MLTKGGTFFSEARREFHDGLLDTVLKTHNGIPSNADRHSKPSVKIASSILEQLGRKVEGVRQVGQVSGSKFEEICAAFLEKTFLKLQHLRPGKWKIGKDFSSGRLAIAQFDQYEHLAELEIAAKKNPLLAAAIGSDYLIKPDVVAIRYPEEDQAINVNEDLVGKSEARLTSLRKINSSKPILHASVSCKWTIRSDRAQNARSEALNLVRNRKGRLPHIVVVTAEPTPNRIASIALGTGDIDCVYHFALEEMLNAVQVLGYPDAEEMLTTMIEGKRLRDICDLPLDLAV